MAEDPQVPQVPSGVGTIPSPSPDMIPFPKPPKKGPVVFMFQPTHYKLISTPEELQLWEKWMIERVGFNPESSIFSKTRERSDEKLQGVFARAIIGGVSGSNGGWDD